MDQKSKTQLKREAATLQKLGERLVELSPDRIEALDIPAQLREAVLAAQPIKQHGARRRQLQYIGTLMRTVDIGSVLDFFSDFDRGQKQLARAFHEVELLRDSLLERREGIIEETCSRFPGADRQRLRQLVLSGRREKEAGKGETKSARALFRYLREVWGEGKK